MKKILLMLMAICLIAMAFTACAPTDTGVIGTDGSTDTADTEQDNVVDPSVDTADSDGTVATSDTAKSTESTGTSRDTATVNSSESTSAVIEETTEYIPKPTDRPDQIIGAESEETLAPEVSVHWPADRIAEIVGEGIPGFTGACDSIALTLLSNNIINPSADITVYGVSHTDVEAYKAVLLDGDFIDGEGMYFLMVDCGMLCINITEESGNMIINANLFRNVGSLLQWPADMIDENAGTALELPVMSATSFELELSVREISDIEVRSAVIACYGSSEAAANAFQSALTDQGYELTDGVYHKMTAEASISISVTDTTYYAPNSFMITVAVTDNFTINHRTPTNINIVYNEDSIRHTVTKIGKDYMFTVDDGTSVTSYFYKYDGSVGKWKTYEARDAADWTLTSTVYVNALDVESAVFGSAVDSNMMIFTYDGDVTAYCGITAKKYVYEYQEGTTVYKLQHYDSGLILEIGVVELDIATFCVTSYTTEVTEFDKAIPQ